MDIVQNSAKIPADSIARLAKNPTHFVTLAEGDEAALTCEDDDCFEPLPEMQPGVASHLHVAGPSGSGKSTFANMYAKAFKDVYGGKVFVISADGAPDPNLTNVDVRVPIDASLADMQLENLPSPALVIFDDVEGLPKPKADALRVFEQAVKERGRKLGIHSISIYHRGAANKATQASLNEATGFVVFPQKISKNVAYMLKRYADIPEEVTGLIRRGKWGRWLIVKPGQYLLGEKKAAVLDSSAVGAIAHAEKKRMNAAAAAALKHAHDGAATAEVTAHGAAPENALSKLSGLGYRH